MKNKEMEAGSVYCDDRLNPLRQASEIDRARRIERPICSLEKRLTGNPPPYFKGNTS